MRRLYKYIVLCLIVVLSINLVGCKNDYSDSYIYFELPGKPSSLDPQTASTDPELILVRNIYEGLLRKNESGSVVGGIATKYHLDGSVYTFELREDAKWSNDTPITASDFVFGLRRALDPKTKSPFASRLFCIQNAQEVYQGKLDTSALGVTAVDDHTLTISLAYEDSLFEEALTTSVAMPCNEEFFNTTNGKYGLSAETTISNGSYVLKKWNKETFGIRMYKNDEYNGNMKAKNSAVFLTCNEEEGPLTLLKKNSVDIAFIKSTEIASAEASGIKTSSYEKTCWVLTLGKEFSSELRTSLAKLVGSEVYGNDLGKGFKPATSIYPSIVNPPESVTNAGITGYDLEGGKQLYSKAVAKLNEKKFPSNIQLFYYDSNDEMKPIITDIVGHWQNNLGAFVNIESASSSDLLLPQLQDQTYSMAIFPIDCRSSRVNEYLKQFGLEYGGQDLAAIQTDLLEGSRIIPLAFEDTNLAYTNLIQEIYTESGNGYIDFSYIIKAE